MAPVKTAAIPTAADFDAIQNRVAVALAKRERLIKSWTASSARPRPPPKSQEELDAEDADLFNPTPAGLGLGAPIPKEFLDGDVKRREISSNSKLRHIILGNRAGLQASKPRDGKEKPISTKRGLEEESSDEDQGRSALGKAKKSKNVDVQNTTSAPIKDGGRTGFKPEAKSTSQGIVSDDPSHVLCPEVRPEVKVEKSTDVSQETSSKIQASDKKRPLVDYSSDDECDYHVSEPVSASPQKKQCSKSSVPTISSPPASTKVGGLQNPADCKRSDTFTRPVSIKTSTTDIISGKQTTAEPGKNLSHSMIADPKKPSSKSGSSYSSKSRASSTESEPSDMETAIPFSLTSDVIGRTSLSTADRVLSPIEAKRAKNRDKRARRKDRERQRKALALGIVSGGAEKSVLASSDTAGKLSNASTAATKKPLIGSIPRAEKLITAPGDTTVIAKKIKDRLLDANGN